MKNALSLISKIREKGNNFIISKLKKLGLSELSPSHGDILFVLYKYQKLTMKEIAQKIGKTKATLSVLVDKLEKAKLVKREKSTQDSRITFILLTQKAKDLEKDFIKISNELNEMLYFGFSREEARIIDVLLKKMAEN